MIFCGLNKHSVRNVTTLYVQENHNAIGRWACLFSTEPVQSQETRVHSESLTDSRNLLVYGCLLSNLTWEILRSNKARLSKLLVFENYYSENNLPSEDHVYNVGSMVSTIHLDSQRYYFIYFTKANHRCVSFITNLRGMRRQHEFGNDKLIEENVKCFQRCHSNPNISGDFVGANSILLLSTTLSDSLRKIAISNLDFNSILSLLVVTGQILLCYFKLFLFVKKFIQACGILSVLRCDDAHSSQPSTVSLAFPLVRRMTFSRRNRIRLAGYLKIIVFSVFAVCASSQSLVVTPFSTVDYPLHSSRALAGTTGTSNYIVITALSL